MWPSALTGHANLGAEAIFPSLHHHVASSASSDSSLLYQGFGEFQTSNQAFPTECMFLILLKKDASNTYIIARTAGGLDLAAIDINPREPFWVTATSSYLDCAAILLSMAPRGSEPVSGSDSKKFIFRDIEDAILFRALVHGAVNYLFTFDCDTPDPLTVHAMSTLYIAVNCFSDSLWGRLGPCHSQTLTIGILLRDRVRFTARPTTSPIWHLAEEIVNRVLPEWRYQNRLISHLLDAIDPSIILPIFTKEGMRRFAIREILTSSIDRTMRWGPGGIPLAIARIKLLIELGFSGELDYKSLEDICRKKDLLFTCVLHTCEVWEQNLRDVVTSLKIARTSFRRKFVDMSTMPRELFGRPFMHFGYPETAFEADCDICKIFLQYSFDES